MAQLLVRGISDETVRALKERAREHGRSAEAEHRAILEAAVAQPLTTAEWAKRLRGSFLADLDADDLRSNDPPREFDWP